VLLVTFSGIDGAGKTTQLVQTEAFLQRRGMKVTVLVTLHFTVTGILARLREWVVARRKTASQEHIQQRPRIRSYPGGRSFDKDRHHWGVRVRRLIAYPVDCIAFASVITLLRIRGYDAVLCDRYIYDKLVCLAKPTGWFAKILTAMVPRPDVAILLVADPSAAEKRKPEHELDYFETKAQAYHDVQEAIPGLTAIESATIEDTQQKIQSLILENLTGLHASASKPDTVQSPSV